MGKFLILILFLAAATCQGRLAYVLHDNDEASPTIVSLDGDINFLDGNSLYSFELLPLNSDNSDNDGTRKWVVHRVGDRRLQTVSVNSTNEGNTDETNARESGSEYTSLIINAIISLFCVATAAMAAGLTMGLLSLDPLTLEIKRRASTSAEERKWSEDLLPLLVGHSKRHRLLVTLLLMNAAANEALPLFLDELFPGKLTSILVSVTLVLFFGEIVPSAFFTGPDQVKVAAKLVPMVKVMMVIMSPLAVPIANVLDKVLHEDGGHTAEGTTHTKPNGEEMEEEDVTGGNYYSRGELSALVRIQYEAQLAAKRKEKMMNQSLLTKNGAKDTIAEMTTSSSNISASSAPASSKHSVRTHNEIRAIGRDLTQNASVRNANSLQHAQTMHVDEITMIEGALTMTTKVAADICTPLRRVYALPSDTVMDEDTMVKIWSRGFSRIPVYSSAPDDEAVSSSDTYDAATSRIIGVLLTRQLIVLNPEEKRPITTLPLAPPPCIAPSVHLVDLINLFQAGGGRGKPGLHLAIVCARPLLASNAMERGEPIPKECGVVGIVTLEDVVEELLQEEIYDESDRDLELARWGVNKWKKFVKSKKAVKSDGHTGAHFDSSLVKKVVIASEINTENTPLLG